MIAWRTLPAGVAENETLGGAIPVIPWRTLLCLLLPLSLGFAVAAQENTPYLYILGVVQDAGYPQSGCYAPHCLPGWQDRRLARGATSIALIDPGGKRKFVFEATPDFPRQLYSLEQEAPARDYELAGIFLTHAHIGHYTGLMFLGHESMGADGVNVYAMPRMAEYLRSNGPWSQLVSFQNIALQSLEDGRTESFGATAVTPFLVPHRDEYSETVGYRIAGPDKSAIFIPDINKWSDWNTDIVELIETVDYALIDATFYADGELGDRDMSRIPHPFVAESMTLFQGFTREQRGKIWFIHLNHTNPLLDPDSDESHYVRSQGYNVAAEGVRLPL